MDFIKPETLDLWITSRNAGSNQYDAQILDLFDHMSRGIIGSYHFRVDKQEAVQDCIVQCWLNMKNYRATKTGFHYFTTMILNHLKGIWRQDRKYENLKRKFYKDNNDEFRCGYRCDPHVQRADQF